jgi:hypothetical protein
VIGRLMRLMRAQFIEMTVRQDSDELLQRTREGTASDVWACHLMNDINRRRDLADGLRASAR